MVFTYFCRQINETDNGLEAEDWGYIDDEDSGSKLITNNSTNNITVDLEAPSDEGKGGCFGTGPGKLR